MTDDADRAEVASGRTEKKIIFFSGSAQAARLLEEAAGKLAEQVVSKARHLAETRS